jgi:hypothetical protein
MSHYILIRRLRGPVILLLVGTIALLHSMGVVHSFWHWFMPIVLIALGLLMLAERAALASEESYGMWPNGGGAPNPGAYDPRQAAGVPPYPGQPNAIVPVTPQDPGKDPNGGQS